MKAPHRRMLIGGVGLVALCFISCSPHPAAKKISPAEADVPRVWLIPSDSTFSSFADCLDTHLGLFPLRIDSSFHDQPINSLEYELRDASRPLRLARLPLRNQLFQAKGSDETSEHPRFHHPWYPDDDRLRRLTGIGPGNYLIALLVNGVRASNVVPIRIDPAYNYKTQPTVRIAKIEAPPLCPNSRLVAWVIGPPAGTHWLSYSDIVGASLLCDGISFASPYQIFHANPTFSPGDRVSEMLEVERYRPCPPLSGAHTYVLQARAYSTAPLVCDLATTPLGDAWDRETDTIANVTPPPPVLSGFVGSRDGHPFPQAEVLIYNEHHSYIELVDPTGHYTFANIPPGKYTADCYRLDIPETGTHAYFPPIVLESGIPRFRNFIFPDDLSP